jgi:hypothetical protein
METIKIVLLVGLTLFLLYVLMVVIREMKGVSSGSNTNTNTTANTNTIYRRARTPVAGPNYNAHKAQYYN